MCTYSKQSSELLFKVFVLVQAPVIVLNPDSADLDLVSSNSHLMHSEVSAQINPLFTRMLFHDRLI